MEGWHARLVLKVMTPVHVGSGVMLKPAIEYDVRDGLVHRLDLERFFEDLDISLQEKNAYLTGHVSPQLKAKLHSRYRLVPRCGRELGPDVREAIKLTGDRPYLPGSTVKGTIRTAIAWHLLNQMPSEDNERSSAIFQAGRERSDQLRARSLENLLFRRQRGVNSGDPDAKSDALKGLIVRDSGPIEQLEYRRYNVVVMHGDRLDRKMQDAPALEAIVVGQEISVDLIVKTDQLQPNDNYRPNREVAEIISDPNRLARVVWDYGNALIEGEIKYYQRAGFDDATKWIGGKGLLPLGFGTGWKAHTVGPLLSTKEIALGSIRFHRGQPPPISRRLALNASGDLTAPLGWVKPRWEIIQG